MSSDAFRAKRWTEHYISANVANLGHNMMVIQSQRMAVYEEAMKTELQRQCADLTRNMEEKRRQWFAENQEAMTKTLKEQIADLKACAEADARENVEKQNKQRERERDARRREEEQREKMERMKLLTEKNRLEQELKQVLARQEEKDAQYELSVQTKKAAEVDEATQAELLRQRIAEEACYECAVLNKYLESLNRECFCGYTDAVAKAVFGLNRRKYVLEVAFVARQIKLQQSKINCSPRFILTKSPFDPKKPVSVHHLKQTLFAKQPSVQSRKNSGSFNNHRVHRHIESMASV